MPRFVSDNQAVIRRHSGNYLFIKECSVLGFIKGEAMRDLPEDCVEEFVFV